jgi:4-hydroxy-3-methylbut-2-enyl diphosphate reductase
MEVLLARDMGFCWGVRRAIDIIEKAAAEKGEVTSLGPIVHNPQVVRDLEGKGVCVTSGPLDGAAGPVAITAHGVGPETLEEARSRGSEVVDTTCPIVTRSQRWARKMTDAGFTVVVFGDPKHREVKGVLAWAGGNALALRDGDRIPHDLPTHLAIISQTTQSPERFALFVSNVMQKRVGEISELRVVNTLCDVTSSQQAAARELAQEVDLILVVGGRSIANTRHLLKVCREEGATAHQIESADELRAEWLHGCQRLGVTAGASTPDSTVETVVRRVQEIAQELAAAASAN